MWILLVGVDYSYIKTKIFTVFWVSTHLYRQWFSPKNWIQEKVVNTDNGFSHKSDFMKK